LCEVLFSFCDTHKKKKQKKKKKVERKGSLKRKQDLEQQTDKKKFAFSGSLQEGPGADSTFTVTALLVIPDSGVA